jgi:dihydroorotate dehydrogenase
VYSILKPLLFLLQAEKAHSLTVRALKLALILPFVRRAFVVRKNKFRAPVTVQGISFENRLGLAAGFDKNAEYFEQMSTLGFGHIEVGTVTPLAQDGNPKPRLFRLPSDRGLINRMGFNNRGVDFMVQNLEKFRNKNPNTSLIIGGNIGKNKVTPNEDAVSDYEKCFSKLYHLVDYFVVNVSSPNTPNLRELQDKNSLMQIFTALYKIRNTKIAEGLPSVPIWLKIAPDLSDTALDSIVALANEISLDGIIATNTTISREGLETDPKKVSLIGNGGLSGAPVKSHADKALNYLSSRLSNNTVLVGVGGICSPEDAIHKINNGATLVQIYSGMVYGGPSLITETLKALASQHNN